MARLARTAAATGLLLLAAACGLEQTLPNPAQPPLPETVDVDIQYENHSSTPWSLLYFEDSEGSPVDFPQVAGHLIAPCEASLAGVATLHPPFRIYLVMGSLEETGAFETVPDVEDAGISPVLDSAALPLRGATQHYQLDIQADGSSTVAPANEPLKPREIC